MSRSVAVRGLVIMTGRMQRADRQCLAYRALPCTPEAGGGREEGDSREWSDSRAVISVLQLIRAAPLSCPAGNGVPRSQ